MERRFERTTRRDEEGLVLFDEIVLPTSMLRELGRRASPALADLLTSEEAMELVMRLPACAFGRGAFEHLQRRDGQCEVTGQRVPEVADETP